MSLSPEIRKLLQQTLTIRDSAVPLHRVMDILATEDGDVSKAVNRFRDIKEPALRRAFHQCALLLRQLEQEAGLAPAWEAGGSAASRPAAAPAPMPSSSPAPAKASPAAKGVRYRPEDLQTFENDAMRGQARMAKAYVDGASKGNPGQAGIGVALLTMGGEKIAQISRGLGVTTNNQAEYTALVEALKLAVRMGVKTLFVFADSELMVKQVNGVYKVKNPEIQERMDEVRELVPRLEKFSITWIPREKNTLADALSTACLPKPKKAASPAAAASEDLMGSIDESADDGSTV